MSEVREIVLQVIDPRGRCNRKGLLILMLVTLLLQALLGAAVFGAGVSFAGPVALVVKLVFVWIAISATIQRLHDVGHSGWWLLAALVGIFVWLAIWGGVVPIMVAMSYGAQHIQLYSPVFFAILLIAYIPVVSGGLWLHFRKGQDRPNRFGPVPTGHGFARRNAERSASHSKTSPVAA